MPVQEMLYTIEELSKLSGTNVRTIRYYLFKELLPPRETRGRRALYGNAHLQRLRLITKIKAANLPLETIKTQLDMVSDDSMDSLLNDKILHEGKSAHSDKLPDPTTEKGESPAAYIARVLDHHKNLSALRAVASSDALPVKSVQPTQIQDFQGDIVQRLEILPDVHLEFKIPLDARMQERIEKILDCVRAMN